MANGIWHTKYEVEINLTLPDLGVDGHEGLLEEITTSTADRDPQLLECLAHHYGRPCESEAGGKSPYMFVRRARVGGKHPLVAAHLPVTHKPTPSESAQHKATKERIVSTASRHGLEAQTEVAHVGRGRRGVADAVVCGPGGQRIGWEVQYSPLTGSGVYSRSLRAREAGLTPLWVAKDDRAALIDRAPWARVDDLPWKEIANGTEMLIRGGFRHLNIWRCTKTAEHRCIDDAGTCGQVHAEWFIPVLSIPEQTTPHLEDLVVGSAVGEVVAVFVPNRHAARAGRFMWVGSGDRQRWEDLAGEQAPPPSEEPEEEDDIVTFAEQDLDRSCRAGEEGPHLGIPRPRRDLAQPTGGLTLPVLDRPSADGGQASSRVSRAERAAAAALWGCPPWEIGSCAGCGQLMRRYGHNAPMACAGCRRAFAC